MKTMTTRKYFEHSKGNENTFKKTKIRSSNSGFFYFLNQNLEKDIPAKCDT